jgi:hypothetical protein
MANLSSPGVSVTVIDESFYTPAAPGTVPLIIVATAENKANASGTGIAPGTLKANSGTAYLITSQKDLIDTFGNPVFKTDASNNPVHAGEQNEYGLQAAYSLLGVSNRAYVVRADLDLNSLNPSATAPANDPANGTHWLDTQNSSWGVFEWNGAARTVAGGQTFTKKTPIVITDPSKANSSSPYAPKSSIGVIGDYAIVSLSDLNTTVLDPDRLWYKNSSGTWVQVGSNAWREVWPTVKGSKNVSNTTPLDNTDSFKINGVTITGANTIAGLLTAINGSVALQSLGVTATLVNNRIELYSNGTSDSDTEDSSASNPIIIQSLSGDIVATTSTVSESGLIVGTYYPPRLVMQPHTSIPEFKSTDPEPSPTGSIWVKTTEPNDGARLRVKRYNSATDAFDNIESPMYNTNHSALYNLDRSGGGINIPVGALYTQVNSDEHDGADTNPKVADFKIFRRRAVGPTTITSSKIIASTFTAGSNNFIIQESLVGSSTLSSPVTISFTASTAVTDAEAIATAINNAGLINISAEVDVQNKLIISHSKGGEIRFKDGSNAPIAKIYVPYNLITNVGTVNFNTAPAGDAYNNNFVASLWEQLRFSAGPDAPTALTADGTLWYNSIIDEIDIMVHNGSTWVGYKNEYASTDSSGPIVSATKPILNNSGIALANRDLWIDTSDIENFPQIYWYDENKPNATTEQKWTLINNSDQSTENGILFADARWNTSGGDEEATIDELLESDFLDPDAPDPALYPKGMLLWNLRRSGFNVKRFVRNYIDINADNDRFGGASMDSYYPHRWVSEAANQDDGSGTFGRKAQRKVVVQALQALVNSNQDIRAEESRVFNLIACPGYPELIGEMITLNYDRGLTAFVVGDTPARLTPDATSLNNWGLNTRLALEDNDLGAASYDEYMAMFYPWGFTSDNFGNNIVVPPSHMILRTIALSDNVSYPWFAPAGTRRGGITNATAVGYVDDEGEFNAVALNAGQRDTLYDVKINPITFLTGAGLVNYGQKTRARNASSLDRINVARLVVYLRRQLDVLAKPYIFEPNDKITRDEIKGAVESLMLELVGQRALYDYIVVCDESNNTPSRIDRNELYVDIAIEPVKAVEFIYIPLRLKNTGEIAGL